MEKKDYSVLISRIESCYPKLTKSEKKVADYICHNMDTVVNMSAQKIAEMSMTGPATVVRFCRSCGFDGLPELKLSLKREEAVLNRMEVLDVLPADSVSMIKQKILEYHIRSIEQLKETWNEEIIAQAAEALLGAARIVISGIGDSAIPASMLQNNLNLVGMNALHFNDMITELDFICRLEEKDVFVCFCYTGRFRNAVNNIKLAKQMGATTIAVLGVPGGPVEKYADIVLYSSTGSREFSFGSHSSAIGDIAIVEVLAAVLGNRREGYLEHQKKVRDAIEMNRYQKHEKY